MNINNLWRSLRCLVAWNREVWTNTMFHFLAIFVHSSFALLRFPRFISARVGRPVVSKSVRPAVEVLEGRLVPANIGYFEWNTTYSHWPDMFPGTPDVIDIYYDFRGPTNEITVTQKNLAVTAMRFWEEATSGKLLFHHNATAREYINIGTGDLGVFGLNSASGGATGIGGFVAGGGANAVAWMDRAENWDTTIGNGNPTGTIDYFTIAAREIGHAIGIGDLYAGTGPDIMASGYSGEKTSWGNNDRIAVQNKYGVGLGVNNRYSVIDSKGTVYTLRDDNWLLRNGKLAWSGIRDFTVDSSNRLVVLNTSGLLERQTSTGWQTLGTSIKKFAVRADGVVYGLREDNWLLRENVPSWSNMKDFAIDNRGFLVTLKTDGYLERQLSGGGWKELGTSIKKFAVRADGVVYGLREDNWLLAEGVKSWNNMKDFAIDNRGFLVTLKTDGYLERQLSGGGWKELGRQIDKFQIHKNNEVYALRSSTRELLVEGRVVWGNTLNFALTRGGTLYWQGGGGLLQKYTSTQGWIDVSKSLPNFTQLKFSDDVLTVSGFSW